MEKRRNLFLFIRRGAKFTEGAIVSHFSRLRGGEKRGREGVGKEKRRGVKLMLVSFSSSPLHFRWIVENVKVPPVTHFEFFVFNGEVGDIFLI